MNLNRKEDFRPRCSHAGLIAAVAVVPMLVLGSCVNEEYDLSKGIDTTVNISADISAPLGSTEEIRIGSFLEIGEESVVQADPETGDYSLQLSADSPFNESIVIRGIDIDPETLIRDGGVSVGVNVRDEIASVAGNTDPNTPITAVEVSNIQLISSDAPETTPITISEDVSDISDIVKEIGSIGMSAPIDMVLSINAGAVTVLPGLEIVFPEHVDIAMPDEMQECSLVDGRIIKFSSPVRIAEDSPFSISLEMTSVDVTGLKEATGGTQGFLGDRIEIDQEIQVRNFSVSVAGSDFGETLQDVPAVIAADITANVTSLDILGVTAVLDPQMQIEDQTVEVGEIPEFLSGDNMTLDVWNPVIRLDVSNSSPVSALLSAMLSGTDESGAEITQEPIAIGSSDPDADNAILIQPGTTSIYISRRGVELPEPPEISQIGENAPLNIVVPEISTLVSRIPSAITLSSISLVVPHEGNADVGYAENDYVRLLFPENHADLTYDIYVDYEIDIPLAFGNGLQIEYPYDLKGLNGSLNPGSDQESSLDVNLKKGELRMTFVNAIPLEMSVTASPIDTEGNVISESDGISVSLLNATGAPAVVASGNIGSETATEAVLELTANSQVLKRLDGFRLNFTGGTGGIEGVPLNENQYIRLTDISVRLDGDAEFEL